MRRLIKERELGSSFDEETQVRGIVLQELWGHLADLQDELKGRLRKGGRAQTGVIKIHADDIRPEGGNEIVLMRELATWVEDLNQARHALRERARPTAVSKIEPQTDFVSTTTLDLEAAYLGLPNIEIQPVGKRGRNRAKRKLLSEVAGY